MAKLWDYAPEMGTFTSEDIVKVRGVVTTWKDTEQLKIDRIRHATQDDGYDLSLLLPCAPFDPAWLYDELYGLAGGFENEELRMLVQYLMREHKEALLRFPAALKLHHATRGGLLHHCWTIVQAARGNLRYLSAAGPGAGLCRGDPARHRQALRAGDGQAGPRLGLYRAGAAARAHQHRRVDDPRGGAAARPLG